MYNFEAKLVDSSRIIADMLVEEIGDDQKKFEAMLAVCLRDKYPLSMRASRVIALCAEKHPEMIEEHLNILIEKLPSLKVEGVKRGFLKIFAENEPKFTEEQLGYLTDLAFRWLDDPKQAMAIRYYCIEILFAVCKKYPELANELSAILHALKDDGSPGLRSRSSFILKELSKMKN